MSAEFYYPERALAFFVIIVLIFYVVRSHKLRKIFAATLKTNKSLDRSASFHAPKNRFIKESLFVVALVLIAFSLMRPRWGEKERRRRIQSVDLCVAVDLSQSMLAEDMSPNRLKFAKREMTLLLEKLGEYRVSLVGFAGGGFIASPLTSDLEAVADLLAPMDTDFVSLPTTSLESALVTCAEALGYPNIKERDEDADEKESAGIILVVTDGDDSLEMDSDVVKGLKRRKIIVSNYLVGKETPMQMPLRDSQGNIAGFVRDPENGSVATTKLLKEKAIELSKETGGKVYVASQLANFGEIFGEDVKRFESKAREEGVEVEKEEQFQIPLLVAFLLLLVEMLLTETGGIWPTFKKKYFNFIWLLFFLNLPLHAASLSESLRNNLGVFLFEHGRYNSAQKWFQDNIESSPDNKLFLYNWASTKLHKIEKDLAQLSAEGKLSPEALASSPAALEADEIAKMIEGINNKETNPSWKKKWNFQLANAYELSGKNGPAINSYYEALKAPKLDNLDTASKHNLGRLLKANSQSGGSGTGDSSGGGGQGESGGENSNDQGQGEQKKPQDYKGKNFTPDQVKQILQNVGSEERNVMKKKSKEESRRRGNEEGEGISNGKPW